MFQVCEELQKWEANENYENIKGKKDSYDVFVYACMLCSAYLSNKVIYFIEIARHSV